jgi:hypothetical protein
MVEWEIKSKTGKKLFHGFCVILLFGGMDGGKKRANWRAEKRAASEWKEERRTRRE